MVTIHALIVAGGSGSRTGLDQPKQYLPLGDGQAILRRSITAHLNHPAISRVAVVINPAHRDLYETAIAGLDLPSPVSGGNTRQESVRLGLAAMKDDVPDFVFIHDAARPFIDAETLTACIDALSPHNGVLVAVPVTDTIKNSDHMVVRGTIDRQGLWSAQTPQIFPFESIYQAHERYCHQSVTDDVALAELAGLPVHIVPGRSTNFKITTEDDYRQALMMTQPNEETRTGFGFDIHALVDGSAVILGGVHIPHNKKLDGHSDADVVLHALTDAILGTIGAGDIGQHFPPSDMQWRGAESSVFVCKAIELLHAANGHIVNADITILAEEPKIGPHRDAMQKNIAHVLGVAPARVNIKATTMEKLGSIGRGEGIAANAIVTVKITT